MSVKLINGIYWVDCRPDGSSGRRVRSGISERKEDAIAHERLLMDAGRKKRANQPEQVRDYTIKALWPRYYEHQCTNFDSEATHVNVADSGQNILRYLGEIDVRTVSNQTPEYLKTRLKNVTSALTKRKLSNATINKHLIWLSGFLRFCRDTLDIPVPIIKIKHLKVERRLPVTLTPDEARRFIRACDPPWNVLFSFCLLCGLRSDEVRNIKWSSFNDGMVTVIGKGNKERSVPVHPWLLDQLSTLPHGNEYVFYNPISRKPLHNFQFAMARFLKKAGINKAVSSHGLRHGFSGMSIASGVDVSILRVLLGHEKISTTQLYVQIGQHILTDASNKVMELVQLSEPIQEPVCPPVPAIKALLPSGQH